MDKNTLLFLETRTQELNDHIALGMKSYLGWRELSYKGLGILAKRLGCFLVKAGVEKGDKVAILSESMPEWGAALFASTISGAISVPLDIKLTIYELTSILTDCQPKIMLVSSAFLQTALEIRKTVTSIEQIVVIDGHGENAEFPSLYKLKDTDDVKWRHRNLLKSALIIYTSGTTGMPKGVEITFQNMFAQMEGLGKAFKFGRRDKFLSILPMNHLFELTFGFLTLLNKGSSVYYSKSLKPKDIFPILQEKQITFMIVVPAFLKLLQTALEAEVKQGGKFKQFMFDFRYSLAKMTKYRWVKKLLFKKIHKLMGGKFRGFVSGGAPLDLKNGKFFETIGIRIFEGYGLSEASPVVSVNTENAHKLGSVGRPLSNVKVKVDKITGELQVKGASVMKGYFNRPEMTADVITEDGWLKTGDIAKIDNDGFIWITGRIKNMIVLSGGKKVFPEEVEAVLSKSPLIQEVCVFGQKKQNGQKEGTENVCVKVVPKQEIIEQYQNEAELDKVIKAEVKNLSNRLSHFKRPTTVVVSKEPLPRNALKKVKRKEITL